MIMAKRRLKSTKDDYPRTWEPRPVSFERWRRHRERMMALARAGSRPDEWWLYDKQLKRPRTLGDEHVTLYEMGELSEAELAKLIPQWREWYEKAQDPNFQYCIGHANPGDTFSTWFKGEAAREALYRWAGIPPALLRKWDAERRRRTKTIRKLAKAGA
jgi:hypothetical protein